MTEILTTASAAERDVATAGKGVAASLLMAQLHAMFRTLIPFGLRSTS